MAQENSFSDENRSLTTNLGEADPGVARETKTHTAEQADSPSSPSAPQIVIPMAHGEPTLAFSPSTPKDRFRSHVKKIIQLRRSSSVLFGVGAEPGIDPRRKSTFLSYGHIKAKCTIEIADYSGVRSSIVRMTNQEFVELMNDSTSGRERWAKVRWINIGGISWDVLG